MASALGWLDHDADAQAKTLDLLARFQQKESRDELGIGTIRDSFAKQLFPGPAPFRHVYATCFLYLGSINASKINAYPLQTLVPSPIVTNEP